MRKKNSQNGQIHYSSFMGENSFSSQDFADGIYDCTRYFLSMRDRSLLALGPAKCLLLQSKQMKVVTGLYK